MTHGKSLELQKLKPKLRIWLNPGKVTLTRGDWMEIRRRMGWDKTDRIPQ